MVNVHTVSRTLIASGLCCSVWFVHMTTCGVRNRNIDHTLIGVGPTLHFPASHQPLLSVLIPGTNQTYSKHTSPSPGLPAFCSAVRIMWVYTIICSTVTIGRVVAVMYRYSQTPNKILCTAACITNISSVDVSTQAAFQLY